MMGRYSSDSNLNGSHEDFRGFAPPWRHVFTGKPKRHWWTCWLNLAIFPFSLSLWLVAMAVALFFCVIILAPAVVIHYTYKRFVDEWNALVDSFRG